MGNIPLVALQGKPPDIRDFGQQQLLDAETKRIQGQNALQPGQLQGQQNELQQQQLQLQQQRQQVADQQAATKALQEWDGTDYNALPSLMLKHGASAATVLGTKTALIKQQTELNGLTESQQAIEKIKNDHFSEALESVLSRPPEEQALALENAKAVSVHKGWLSPKEAQAVQYQGPQQLEAYRKMLIGRGAALDEVLKNSQALEAQGKGTEAFQRGNLAEVGIPGAQAESTIKQQEASLTPQARGLQGNLYYAAAGGDPRKALQLETQQKIAAAQAPFANEPAGLKGVAPHLVAPAAAAAEKAGNEYGDAVAAANDMKTFVDLAKAGNKVAYAYSPTEGVLTLNTARGVKRVNMAEISSYGGAGAAADRVMGFLGKQASGASIPDNVLNDMQSLHQSIAGNAKRTYANKLKNTNQTYGSNFEPVDMGGGTVKMKAPNGQTKDVSPDEVEHYKKMGATVVQ
jgi:hypothetical protein